MTRLTFKRGDSLSLGGTYTTDAGVAVNLTGYTMASHIRDAAGTLIGTFVVTIDAGTAGTFELTATAATTALWAPDTYACDIEFTSAGGEVYSTETFAIVVIADITRAA